MGIDIQTTVKNLHPLEIRILLAYKKSDELTVGKVEKDLGLKSGNGNQALSWLAGKGLVSELRRIPAVFYELTELGRDWQERGTVEERIVELVRAKSGLSLPDIARELNLENKDSGSAFGALSKLGVLSLDSEKKVIVALGQDDFVDGRPAKGEAGEHFAVIRSLLNKAVTSGILAETDLSAKELSLISGISKKRGAADAAFRQVDRETVVFAFAVAEDGSVPAELAAAALNRRESPGTKPETSRLKCLNQARGRARFSAHTT